MDYWYRPGSSVEELLTTGRVAGVPGLISSPAIYQVYPMYLNACAFLLFFNLHKIFNGIGIMTNRKDNYTFFLDLASILIFIILPHKVCILKVIVKCRIDFGRPYQKNTKTIIIISINLIPYILTVLINWHLFCEDDTTFITISWAMMNPNSLSSSCNPQFTAFIESVPLWNFRLIYKVKIFIMIFHEMS